MAGPDEGNRNLYARSGIVSWYASRSGLQPAEAAILSRLEERLRGARILDIGIGGGRTTEHLLPLAGEYVGIDYVSELVEAARGRFPDARLEQGDARDLSRFDDDSFDFVLFSFNGIDYVSHEGRLQVLAEVRRVLRPGGQLMFSTHNREHPRFDLLPWQGRPPLDWRLVRASVNALWATPTRRRMRRDEVRTPTYAIVNDDAHHYRLLTYYISGDHQVCQLEDAGFTDVVPHDGDGRPGGVHHTSAWLYFLATG